MNERQKLVQAINQETGLDIDKIDELIEIPPQPTLGDYAFPCFVLAKTLRKAPAAIAAELAVKLGKQLTDFERVESVGGYLNFFVNRSSFITSTIMDVRTRGAKFGSAEAPTADPVIIEYSSPNIAKPFHVGHAFTTILGHSLARIYKHLGYNVVRMNHLGDYGTQFGKLIVAYEMWGDETALQAEPIKELLRIYVKFHTEAEKDPELEVQARERFRRLEAGEAAEEALWTRFRDLSLKEFSEVYERLGVSFDNYNGESFYSNQIPAVVDLLTEKGLLESSEGAQVVRLDEFNLPPCIILKSDGTTIYASRDIAAVLYRYQQWHFAKNIYVVGTPQALHFRQVFAVLKKAGFDFADDCVHVGFGLVRFADRKLSTRSGDVIYLQDLLQEAVDKTHEVIRANAAARSLDLTEEKMSEIAEKVGIGAVTYTFLKNSRERDIVFSYEEMLDFEGDSAPYVLYTYARGRSILRKAAAEPGYSIEVSEAALLRLDTDEEFAIAKLVESFPQSVVKAAQTYEPFMVVRQITQLARAFNKFYHNEPVLSTADPELRQARLALVDAVCDVLYIGMELAGINPVEQM
jgi:arginyl-tRNA synthetase